jgi:multidrug efflux pump subunit AcrA (membrane-fusion protein)
METGEAPDVVTMEALQAQLQELQLANQALNEQLSQAQQLNQQFQQAQSELRLAQTEIARRDGVIAHLQASAGTTASSSSRTSAAPKLPKYPEPDRWNGRGDIMASYGIPVKRWLEHYGLEATAQGVELASARLPTFLQATWTNHMEECKRAGNQPPNNFDAFFKLIKSWYPQPDSVRQAMEKMDALRHKRNQIQEYNERWSWIVIELGNQITSYTINFKYFKGLQLDIQKDLEGKFDMKTITHSDLMSLAAEAEARQKLQHRSQWRSNTSSYSNSASSSSAAASNDNSGPIPMEINTTQGVKPCKTEAGFKGICYRCKQRGHKAADCPTKSHEPKK